MPKDKKAKLSLAVGRKSLAPIKKKKEHSEKSPNSSFNKSQELSPQKVETADDDGFLQRPYVEKAVSKFFTQLNDDANDKELFDDDKVVYMQICAAKIAKGNMKTVHLNMQHCILPEDHDILLITPDLKTGNKSEYDKNAEHYRALLEKHEITGVKEIISMHQLRAEYTEYEMQNRLMGLYDMIIADTSVHSYVMKAIGTTISKRNKLYGSLKLVASNLKGAFEKVLSQGNFTLHDKGDYFSVCIGHTGMEEVQLVDNIMAAAEELKDKFPGGWAYVQGLFIKTPTGKGVQFYLSNINSSPMKVPVVKGQKPRMSHPVKDELSTAMDAKVTVMPSGAVFLHEQEGDGNADFKSVRNRKQPDRLQMARRKSPMKKTHRKKKMADKENEVVAKKKSGAAKKKKLQEEPLNEAGANKKNKKGTKKVKAEVKDENEAPKKKKVKAPKKEPVKTEPDAGAEIAPSKPGPKSRKQLKTEPIEPKEEKEKETKVVAESKPKVSKKPKEEKTETIDEAPKKKTSPKRKNSPVADISAETVEVKKAKKTGKKKHAAS